MWIMSIGSENIYSGLGVNSTWEITIDGCDLLSYKFAFS